MGDKHCMINYYLLLTKPGIIFGNLITVTAGFFLASRGTLHFDLLLATLLGLAFIIASGCVFNNYIDRSIDKKMERTKNRPLINGLISGSNAIIFGSVLGIIGALILFFYTNLLTLFISAIGFFVYVLLYSFWKTSTVYATAIGSIAGAIPPVAGYCAVSNQFDLGAFILFLVLIFWQMPHFFSIAIYHFKDYVSAGIPLLPVKKGMWVTKIHMVLYILGFIFAAAMLTFFNYTGNAYLLMTAIVGLLWLGLCLKGFTIENDQLWGKQMFRLSLVMINVLCLMIFFDAA